jgi:hypothetical protein
MQTLKSILVVILLSFCAFQSNANVLPVVSSSIEIGGIIEWGTNNKTIIVNSNTLKPVNVQLTNSNNEIVIEDILAVSPNVHLINLEDLPEGVYKFSANSGTTSVTGTVIIE